MKKLFTLLVLVLQMNALSAQQENVWAFGNNAGINFNGTPSAITTALSDGSNFLEACAAVSGANGRLLFYTEGTKVWDSTHTLMPSGTDLTQYGADNMTSSTSQGALIVPMPDSGHKFYIFSLTDFSGVGRLSYSVVDMSLNGGKGDVVPAQTNILLDSNLTEKMTAVPGPNCNAWVVVSSRTGSFKAFEVTTAGVSGTPVISSGSLGSGVGLDAIGSLTASFDGSMLAECRMGTGGGPATLQLYDFNPATGAVSNPVTLVTDTFVLGVCFSPDDSKLYFSSSNPASIFQFDLSLGTPSAIIGSLAELGSSLFFTHVKTAPDGKVYFFQSGSSLGSIDFPNLAGTAAQYTATAITLQAGTNGGFGLPNIVPVLQIDSLLSRHNVVVCNNDTLTLSADSLSGWEYTWNDGLTGPDREVTAAGTYWVKYRASCRLQTDTFVVTKVTLGAVITLSGLTLSTTQPYAAYQWLLNGTGIAGATNSTHTAAVNGDYSVVVHDVNGCSDTSNVVTVTNVGIDDPGGMAQQIRIYPNPAGKDIHIQSPVPVNAAITGLEGRRISYVENVRILSVAALAEGVYLLHFTDSKGVLLKVEKLVIAH